LSEDQKGKYPERMQSIASSNDRFSWLKECSGLHNMYGEAVSGDVEAAKKSLEWLQNSFDK
jgi:hypothetical protein